jgi:hypothetical protein
MLSQFSSGSDDTTTILLIASRVAGAASHRVPGDGIERQRDTEAARPQATDTSLRWCQ